MQRASNSNLVEVVDSRLTIRNMPDPEDIYSTALRNADVSNSSVFIPNIRDGNGDIITPIDYEKKLEDGSIVMINAFLKLYAQHKFLLLFNINYIVDGISVLSPEATVIIDLKRATKTGPAFTK